MSRGIRIMALDGDYSHTLAVQAEVKRSLNATVYSVSSSVDSPGYRSRYTDVPLLAPRSVDRAFEERLIALVAEHEPDIVVPVGYAGFLHTISVTDRFPPSVRALVPHASAFSIASSKTRTYEAARRLGIRVPEEYAVTSDVTGRRVQPSRYPLFAKARVERGGVSTALLRSEAEFRAFDPESLGGDVIFQEYIAGDPFTYGQNGYYENGQPLIAYQHVELRSVPRRGGSGTRVRVVDSPQVAALADRLLADLHWNGVAQVEFRLDASGVFVLMEINPKVWASYALAPRSGHPIAATAVARVLGVEMASPAKRRRTGMSMVFPIREFGHALRHRQSESLAASAVAMLWPPAHSDVDIRDIGARWPGNGKRRRPGSSDGAVRA